MTHGFPEDDGLPEDDDAAPCDASVDWDMPPEDAEVLGLASALHDARVIALSCDRAACTSRLVIDPMHVRFAGKWDPAVRVILTIEGVRAVRAQTWIGPPEWKATVPATHDEAAALKENWRRGGRYESVAWGAIEEAIGSGPFDVTDAFLARDATGVALRMEGTLAGEFYDLVIAGHRLHVSRSDGKPFDLDGWIALGDAFWQALEATRTTR